MMNDSQLIFTAFYAIFFTFMAQAANGSGKSWREESMFDGKKLNGKKNYSTWFNLFDLTSMESRFVLRFVISIFFLDFLPAIYFIYILILLNKFHLNIQSHEILTLNLIVNGVLIIWLSLAPSGFYRIQRGIVIWLKGSLYSSAERKIIDFDQGITTHLYPLAHILPGFVFYILLPFMLLIIRIR